MHYYISLSYGIENIIDIISLTQYMYGIAEGYSSYKDTGFRLCVEI